MQVELITLQEETAAQLATMAEDLNAKLAELAKRRTEAVSNLQESMRLNAAMQAKHAVGTPEWHAHETIDDRLHDVSCALGE